MFLFFFVIERISIILKKKYLSNFVSKIELIDFLKVIYYFFYIFMSKQSIFSLTKLQTATQCRAYILNMIRNSGW